MHLRYFPIFYHLNLLSWLSKYSYLSFNNNAIIYIKIYFHTYVLNVVVRFVGLYNFYLV